MSRNDCCVSWNDDHTQTCPTRVIPALQAQLAEARNELELLRRVAGLSKEALHAAYGSQGKLPEPPLYTELRDALREWEAGRK